MCGDAEAGVVGWTVSGATGVIQYPYTQEPMGWGRLIFSSSEHFVQMKLVAEAGSMPRSKAKGAKATWRGLRTAVPWGCELQEPNVNKCSKQVQSVCLPSQRYSATGCDVVTPTTWAAL